jgi:hypothetical protein
MFGQKSYIKIYLENLTDMESNLKKNIFFISSDSVLIIIY